MGDIDGPLFSPVFSFMGSDLFLIMITDDPIGINFDEDKFSYQIIRDRIMVAVYGNTGISVDSGLGDSGSIIAGRKREKIVSFFL